jgi:cholest-4-en-3-one 26-monooxygenase
MQLDEIDVTDPMLITQGDPTMNGIPFEMYEFLRDEAPCFWQPITDPVLIEGGVWVLSRYEDVVRVSRDTTGFSSAEGVLLWRVEPTLVAHGGKPAMLTMDGGAHTRNRRLVSRGFTPGVVRRFEDELRILARGIVTAAVSKRDFDFVSHVATELPLQAICRLMGVPEEDRSRVLAWSNAFAVPTDLRYAPTYEESLAGMASMWEYGRHLAVMKREHPGDDLMSKMVELVDDEVLTDEELMGFFLLAASAGNETTRNSLGHGLYGLLQHPQQMEWMQHRAGDLPDTAIEEILRWASPVAYFRRTATRDVRLHGCDILAGQSVLILHASANFDERAFPAPKCFDLSRSPNRHVSFGTGPHVCLGAHIARLEIKVVLEELFRATEAISLAGPVSYNRDSFLRGVRQLPLSVQ